MGGRIEIPMEEYNALKGKIKELEGNLNDSSKEIIKYQDTLNELQENILSLKNEGLFRRMFKWNEVIYPLINMFNYAIG